MSNEAVEGVPLAPTPRLVFDRTVEEPDTNEAIQDPTVYRDIREPVNQAEDLEASPELDEMTVDELKKHEEEVQRKIKEKQDEQKQAVINQIVEVVQTYEISIEDLVNALGGMKIKRKGVKAEQKYRDPVTGATWSGRGKEPVWIRDKNREDFLIKN